MSKRICVFGDSIVAGSCDADSGGWVNRLTRNIDNSVYNLGVSGDTSDDVIKRFEIEVQARKPKIIIIAIGINDSSFRKMVDGYYVKAEKYLENLRRILDISKKYSDKIIFNEITKVDEKKTNPIPWNKEAYYKNEDIKKYNIIIKELCSSNNLLFIELYDLLENIDLDDGLHPNAQGHEKIYNRVKNFLIENKII